MSAINWISCINMGITNSVWWTHFSQTIHAVLCHTRALKFLLDYYEACGREIQRENIIPTINTTQVLLCFRQEEAVKNLGNIFTPMSYEGSLWNLFFDKSIFYTGHSTKNCKNKKSSIIHVILFKLSPTEIYKKAYRRH